VKVTPARRLRAGLAIPAAFALVAFVTFIGLGTWQIQRKAWKEGLIETLEQRLSAPPTDLPPREWWAKLDHEAIYQSCRASLDRLGLGERCHLLRATATQALPLIIRLAPLDMLHIDGNHSLPVDVHRQSRLVSRRVRP